jgi:uncharacterized membrane protein (DUF106 family)
MDPEINPLDTVTILLFSVLTTCVAELANYIMFYSKDDYKKISAEIDRLAKEGEKLKEDTGNVANKAKVQKSKDKNERSLKAKSTGLNVMKMKSNVLVGLFFIVTVSSLANYFQGFPVARLPFSPFGFFTGITHRGLIGEDYTECSYIFLYMITTFVIRGNITKIFGFEGPKTGSMNPFFPDPNQFK